MFGFIFRGRVSTLADIYGFYGEPRRDLEFTGIQVGRFLGLGFLRAKVRTGEAQPRIPSPTDSTTKPDYDPEPSFARPVVQRKQDPARVDSPLPAGWRRAVDPPREEDQ